MTSLDTGMPSPASTNDPHWCQQWGRALSSVSRRPLSALQCHSHGCMARTTNVMSSEICPLSTLHDEFIFWVTNPVKPLRPDYACASRQISSSAVTHARTHIYKQRDGIAFWTLPLAQLSLSILNLHQQVVFLQQLVPESGHFRLQGLDTGRRKVRQWRELGPRRAGRKSVARHTVTYAVGRWTRIHHTLACARTMRHKITIWRPHGEWVSWVQPRPPPHPHDTVHVVTLEAAERTRWLIQTRLYRATSKTLPERRTSSIWTTKYTVRRSSTFHFYQCLTSTTLPPMNVTVWAAVLKKGDSYSKWRSNQRWGTAASHST